MKSGINKETRLIETLCFGPGFAVWQWTFMTSWSNYELLTVQCFFVIYNFIFSHSLLLFCKSHKRWHIFVDHNSSVVGDPGSVCS